MYTLYIIKISKYSALLCFHCLVLMNTIAEANTINCKKRNCGFVGVNDKIINFYNKNIFFSLDVNLIRISVCDSNIVCLKMCLLYIFLIFSHSHQILLI